MTPNDATKILTAINSVRTDVAVLRTQFEANVTHGERIRRLELCVVALFFLLVGLGLKAAGMPLPGG